MIQNLIIGFALLAAIAYLAVSYIKKRRNKTGCAHCAVANVNAANGNRDNVRSGKS